MLWFCCPTSFRQSSCFLLSRLLLYAIKNFTSLSHWNFLSYKMHIYSVSAQTSKWGVHSWNPVYVFKLRKTCYWSSGRRHFQVHKHTNRSHTHIHREREKGSVKKKGNRWPVFNTAQSPMTVMWGRKSWESLIVDLYWCRDRRWDLSMRGDRRRDLSMHLHVVYL